ncbi:MAG TPA: hypothetical protein VES00_19890, partial [Burkholderiaceae bacterium]|nr:hypothetical protein [Burkholderiaceae bacterium]
PNPWVGCVVVPAAAADAGAPVFEGATAPPGGPHAEVAALRAAGADIAFETRVDGNPTAFVRDCAGNLIEFLQPFELRPGRPA